MYHGIVLDAEFTDPTYPETYSVFAKRKSTDSPWMLFGIEISDQDIEKTIADIQKNMKSDEPYYAHLYNDEELIVVFKENVFRVKPHIATWRPIIEYGKTLHIPASQLTFWPNRFQDEIHYFKPEDFI